MPDQKRQTEKQYIYTAWFIFKGDEYLEHFDNYFEAVKWCCVRLENIGEKRERFAKVKVEMHGVIVWEMPETVRVKPNPFGFAHFTIR